ncbi:prepilin-type N-terminal cleavage/methylation domain-containing protein [Holzapfeliella sp. He02]|uniref:Prepilin-type N-terminal cleavage/methylation domain-containing protein n=1 Tax=Holzapfeliella saturejae TaxID=3082953 RepID=A0ABU8SG02_9LACO
MKNKVKGFTLIEMCLVIAIIAILVLLIVPNITQQKQKAEQKIEEAFQTTLQTQLELQDKSITNLLDLELSPSQKEKAKDYEVVNGLVKKRVKGQS